MNLYEYGDGCDPTPVGYLKAWYNIVTLEANRRRGIDLSMTILHATKEGARVYKRLGFKTFGLDAWSDEERARFWRIVSVIKTAPEDGTVIGNLSDGRAIRQMTGTNMRIQYYRETFAVGPAVFVVRIFILDWKLWYVKE